MRRYLYFSKDRALKATYEGVTVLRIDEGLTRVMRKANEQEYEYQTFDPYVTVAIIRLGDGERLVLD